MRVDEALAAAAQRQQVFADAVIAIAVTLLALGLPVPRGDTNAELLASAGEHLDDYSMFCISFVVIFLRWSSHHRVFRYVVGTDRTVGLLSGVWLFLLVLTPFTTEVLSGDGAFQVRFGLYATVQGLVSVTFLFMTRHVVRTGLARDVAPSAVFSHAIGGSATSAAGFFVSIPVSFVTPWAYALWAAVPVLAGVLARARRRAAGLA
ncbi:TMEM175 family protein [Prauserella cavernicola]|uniref:DUF1211 domain-containing protein n=1 Tax=Prauserella cavernicola TaxID=2800127 RepID=A0A934V7J4_9PSEU|nr:TMEM175 family protein [Prauserella cavernicola]MBK1787764.1 DUF1211 domain-containing protein [Prauserella cavernicola]